MRGSMISVVRVAVAGAVLLSACARVTVTSNAMPAPVTVEKRWQHAFLGGIVPPAEVNARETCPNGVASVQTFHSFPNMLVTLVTMGIYSPVSLRVVCAER